MSATIRFGNVLATVTHGRWACQDEAVRAFLQQRAEAVGDSPSIPDLDDELSRDAVEQFGAVMVQASDKPPPADDDETVY